MALDKAMPNSAATGVGEPIPSRSDTLMAVAAGLFRRKGYAATTTREIAELVGLEKGSLYHYIQGKEDLLYHLCVESLSNIQTQVAACVMRGGEAKGRLKELIAIHVRVMLEEGDKHAVMLVELRSLRGQNLAHVITLRDEYEALIRGLIGECQTAGLLRTDISAGMLTLALLNLLNWSIFWYDPTGPLSPRDLASVLTRIYLDGANVADSNIGR
ncbi:MAG: TetR family transcriptional regulator [Candidatus Dormibacteria bacterium]